MIYDKKELFFDNEDITGTSAEINTGVKNKPMMNNPMKIFAAVSNAGGVSDGTIDLQAAPDNAGSAGSFASVALFTVSKEQLQKGWSAFFTPDFADQWFKVVVTTLTGTGYIGLAKDTQTNM